MYPRKVYATQIIWPAISFIPGHFGNPGNRCLCYCPMTCWCVKSALCQPHIHTSWSCSLLKELTHNRSSVANLAVLRPVLAFLAVFQTTWPQDFWLGRETLPGRKLGRFSSELAVSKKYFPAKFFYYINHVLLPHENNFFLAVRKLCQILDFWWNSGKIF